MDSKNQDQQDETKVPKSDRNNLRLISFEPNSYGGIHDGMSLVIMFEAESRLIEFRGQQGTGKTSALNFIKYMAGGDDIPNAINTNDDNKKGQLSFEKGGETYVVRTTKSAFTITTTKQVGDKVVSVPIPSPRTEIKNLFGPLGINPHSLKDMDGAKQLVWFRSLLSISDEHLELEKDIAKKRQKAYDDRTDVNRKIRTIKSEVVGSGYFTFDDKSQSFVQVEENGEKKYTVAKRKHELPYEDKYNEVEKKVQEAEQESTEKTRYVNNLSNLQEKKVDHERSIDETEKEIQRLQALLAQQQEQLKNVEERIVEGEKLIQEKFSKTDEKLAQAREEFRQVADYKSVKIELDALDALLNKYKDEEDECVRLNKLLVEYDKKKQEFIKALEPEIDGLEVCVPKDIDVESERTVYLELHPDASDEEVAEYINNLKPEKREGLYYKGHSVDQLCESELWEMALNIWKHTGVKVALIENITSLGTDACKAIEEFSKGGNWVFYTAMDRSQSELNIKFYKNIQI